MVQSTAGSVVVHPDGPSGGDPLWGAGNADRTGLSGQLARRRSVAAGGWRRDPVAPARDVPLVTGPSLG
ncbi:hypothetical protein AB0C38_06765 [Amycolatopsis sp. NPDC048633]|uniref:hypothetical protein n=1 Tax=Amycolatopsis sp. NPDC048633 TaxID=3157095 RepID=UPI0033F0189D